MNRPTVRVLALLELLQSGGTRTMAELADQLGVDTRTVRRYIAHLIDLEVPVESVRGRYGGYRLGTGYRLPPLMFSDDEALAVLMGLIALQRTGSAATATAGDTAAAKIRRVLPTRLANRLAAVVESLSFTEPAGTSATPDASTLLAVTDAIRHHRPLAIRYTDRQDRHTQRVFHARAVVVHSGHWYVTGTDPGAGQDRTLRLDRIIDARILPGSFEPVEDPDPAQSLLAGFATAAYRYNVALRIHATIDQIRHKLPAGIATMTDDDPTPDSNPSDERWHRVVIHSERLDWIPPILATLDRPFTIEQPAELRTLVTEFADRFTARAHQA
ncbi:helix-turn-helix transcriptional regulator [Nocardia niigatensis]|uniref:helix-turn-helix transcriptional regulator n=1 Tax=Nocardia niigatensis TaxID=209249 RepID=UPI0005933C0D|nr:YafY family protein [Nocardia niigatensis]